MIINCLPHYSLRNDGRIAWWQTISKVGYNWNQSKSINYFVPSELKKNRKNHMFNDFWKFEYGLGEWDDSSNHQGQGR